VSRVRIGRCGGCGTRCQLRADIAESGFEMVHRRAHLRRIVGLSRCFQSAHRGADDVVDDRLNARTLHQLCRRRLRTWLMLLVLRDGDLWYQRDRHSDRKP
jgi:hypothetical protein